MLASRPLLLAALVVLVGACGGGGLPPPANATPAPSAASTGAAAVPLQAGTYTTQAFAPTLTYTVPAGWELVSDTAAFFQLRPAGSEVQGIYLFRDAVAAAQDATCPQAPAAGVGSTSADLVAWMRALPGLTVSTPGLATVGGLRGTSIDVGIADGWTASCPFANNNPTVPLIVASSAGYRWIIVGNERLRFYLLDVPGSGNLIVDVDAFDGTQIDALLAQATPIVKSFSFATD